MRVQATLDGEDGWPILDVEDDGIGIAPADQSRLFERFYRVDKARSRELGGTGLGLSIVKHVALSHDGNVSLRSALGEGSKFRVQDTRCAALTVGACSTAGLLQI